MFVFIICNTINTIIMEMKLIKIENEYYLTTEAKVEKGDYGVIFAHGISGFGRGWHTFHHEGTPGHKLNAICAGTRKITHSTAPIDADEVGSSFHIIEQLSLKNCQAIENGYDLDELAMGYDLYENINFVGQTRAYKEGFLKALEILGDKKFSEDDVNLAFVLGKNKDESRINKLINSKLQQTEWDVIIKTTCDGMVTGLCCSEVCDCNIIPKLDEDGCLILSQKLSKFATK